MRVIVRPCSSTPGSCAGAIPPAPARTTTSTGKRTLPNDNPAVAVTIVLDMESRYSRQIRFAPFGQEGQRRLRSARVAIAGCGALGSAQAELLARAGVGSLRLIDRDFVEWSNLQRQFLFTESDAREALPKAAAAARRLREINQEVALEPVVADLTPANAAELFEHADLILDGCDNFETRYLINDAAVRAGVPWIYGAAVGSYGLTLPVVPERTACFRCVYPEPPARDPGCPCCARREFVYLDGSRRAPVSLCGRNAVQIHEHARPVDLKNLAARLGAIAPVRANEFALRVAIEPYEMTVFPDGRAIITGTTDIGLARSLYARYIGA